ncbi:molybdopterin converting factor subunit 1 [Macrococcus animalis]|uniref:molybdopterin converting factor subunit 1 n=1 Tax=Macrococcus animalis TaxID=3395467 RepID=UPI0039BE3F4D
MKILYFAHIKSKVNRSQDEFMFSEPITVAELKSHLGKTYPNIQGESYQIAVNEEFVKDDETIHNTDVVALIPPVSGG